MSESDDDEPETKSKRYGVSEEMDDGAIDNSDDSDWTSNKLPKKKTKKVISGQASKATRMSSSNTKGTIAAQKNNRTQSTSESKEREHNMDDLAHAKEKTASDNQANTTPAESRELKKSLIVSLKSSGRKFTNLADRSELTKLDQYNYGNLPDPSDLTNEQKKAIYNANPAFTLASGNKDDIRLNNFGTPGYENGMPSISQVLNSAPNNQHSGFPMMPATQNALIGPGYVGMLSQTPHYQSMINNTDPLNHRLDFSQNNGIVPQSQSISSGYMSPEYFQQGLTSGRFPFRPHSLSIPLTNRDHSVHNAIGANNPYDLPIEGFSTPTFDDEFKATSKVTHGTSMTNSVEKVEATGSFGNLDSQIGTTFPSTPRHNRTDTCTSVLDTKSPTDMNMGTSANSPQIPVSQIKAGPGTQDGDLATMNSSLDGFGMDSFPEVDLDEASWFSFGD